MTPERHCNSDGNCGIVGAVTGTTGVLRIIMQIRNMFVKFVGLLILGTGVVPAAVTATEFTVEVGGADTVFTPSTLSITAGDSVRFVNKGGSHNVAADNGSWVCANGCSDAGGNGSISSSAWSFTRTFNNAGTVGYYCQNHGAPNGSGMAGSITVNAAASVGQNIVGGISGNWYNPTANQGGHGFQIEILPGNGILAIWFVFNPAGNAQTWIYSQGSYSPTSNTVSIDAFLEQGQGLAFPPNYNPVGLTATPWGQIQFTFTDCNNGTVAWKSNAASAAAGYGDVSFPITRLTSIAGTTCP